MRQGREGRAIKRRSPWVVGSELSGSSYPGKGKKPSYINIQGFSASILLSIYDALGTVFRQGGYRDEQDKEARASWSLHFGGGAGNNK